MKITMNNERVNFTKLGCNIPFTNLLGVQIDSYLAFLQPDISPEKRENKGLELVLRKSFPIEDIYGRFILSYKYYRLGKPKYNYLKAQEKGVNYSVPLYLTIQLTINEQQGDKMVHRNTIEQEIYFGDVPMMTENGSFIINGVERIVINQIHRAPGLFFKESGTIGDQTLYVGQIIPYKGAWIELGINKKDIIYINLDRKKSFPISILLKALGYETNEKILSLFFKDEKIKLKLKESDYSDSPLLGRIISKDIINEETGEIIEPAARRITPEVLFRLKSNDIKIISLIEEREDDNQRDITLIVNTLRKDGVSDQEEAAKKIYFMLKGSTAANKEISLQYIKNTYFDAMRYDLAEIGRYKINKKLKSDHIKEYTLTPEDIINIIKYFFKLQKDDVDVKVDDIDSLTSRRVKRVGELLQNQFAIALAKASKVIKEKMLLKDIETISPKDLVNARFISSIILNFFTTSQLSQFLEQVNPLSELTHKRRISALGPGGLTRETAGFEVRDVHYSHYGRICPIETPEGQNIGVIVSLASLARVNKMGLIETPYRKVIKGKVSNEIEYLDTDAEEEVKIAQANALLKPNGEFEQDHVLARWRGYFPRTKTDEISYMDVTPAQLVSIAATVMPFLEHDDANRALMGSNMQRQSVPLIRPEAPIVGTGMEKTIAKDSKAAIFTRRSGTVIKVTSKEIVIEPDDIDKDSFEIDKYDRYELVFMKRTNQNTSIIQLPKVEEGQHVEKNELIVDGQSVENGELALGKNILVAFMPWYGYNFEDAIIISERLVRDDVFASIHIQEFETEIRETKLGPEELTMEIPNVSNEAVMHLSENGIVQIGTEVGPEDILVGKVSPKGESELTPEERLLRAIFKEKAADVRDTSKRVPPGVHGVVVDTQILSRSSKSLRSKSKLKREIEVIKKNKQREENKYNREAKNILINLLDGKTIKKPIKDKYGAVLLKDGQKITEKHIAKWDLSIIELKKGFVQRVDKKAILIIDRYNEIIESINSETDAQIEKLEIGDDLPYGTLQRVKVFIAQKRNLQVGDKMAGRHGNKGVISKIVPLEDLPYLPDGTPVDIILNPLGVPSRMNVGQILETHLGWAGKVLGIKFATPVFEGAEIDEIKDYLKKAELPLDGKMPIYDGHTGELIDDKITVGYIYMMKLIHMVEDKIHARSTGPYSLITQQPLGGKAQFGGQRFGEMEVWALEAYGAAYTLQEMLTVKSDDVPGRTRLYESIIKGENSPEPGLPASFNVLLKELNGLSIDIELQKEGELT